MLKINSFSMTQQKTSGVYLDIVVFITSKFPSSCHTLARISPEFEFRLNGKQRLMFHQGPISDNKFMSVDAAQFFWCANPTNCLLSMNKSAGRCVFCTVSKT